MVIPFLSHQILEVLKIGHFFYLEILIERNKCLKVSLACAGTCTIYTEKPKLILYFILEVNNSVDSNTINKQL